MEGILPKGRILGVPLPEPQLSFRRDFEPEGLSDAELEVLGPILPELVGELLQMSQDIDKE